MTRTKMLLGVLLLIIVVPSAYAVTLPSFFDEPCSGSPTNTAICEGVNAINDELEAQILRINSINATQILQGTDISILQGNITSIDNRLTTAETHVLNHHNEVEPDVATLQGNVTSLDTVTTNNTSSITTNTSDVQSVNSTVSDLQTTHDVEVTELQALIDELESISAGTTINVNDVIPYKSGGNTRAVIYAITPTAPANGDVKISIFMPNGTLDSFGGGGTFSAADVLIFNPIDGLWSVLLNDTKNQITDSDTFEIVDANLPTQSPQS